MNITLKNFVNLKNKQKKLFTPGPASLLIENITALQPCFGRSDSVYDKIENRVLDTLKKMSGHKKIARLQGAASLALEVMVNNFLFAKILIIETGIYSDRLFSMAHVSKKLNKQIFFLQFFLFF